MPERAGQRRFWIVQWWRGFRCSRCGSWQRSQWFTMHTEPCALYGFTMEPV